MREVIDVHTFVSSQRDLLELELKAEEDEERSIASLVRNPAAKSDTGNRPSSSRSDDDERPSHVLRPLETFDVSVGLYGRTMVTLALMNGNGETLLPMHKFTVGDEVEIHSKDKSAKREHTVHGVISKVTERGVTIALFGKRTAGAARSGNENDQDENDQEDFLGRPPLAVIPKSSVEVHRKLVQALDQLQRHGRDHPVAGNVIDALFGQPKAFPECKEAMASMEPFNQNLDASQLEAISFAIKSDSRPIALIHGPPGTGKTTTMAELIQQAVHVRKYKVLVTAPSNVAVDNVLERLVTNATPKSTSKLAKRKDRRQGKLKLVRLGHPARIKESILPYSLESLVQDADGTEIVRDVRTELESYLRILSDPKRRGTDKRLAYREMKALRKEVRTREQKVVKDLIGEAQVVLATTVGAANSILNNVDFDLVVIDEAAQALEASCWIPILRGRRLVLAGDHCQLPPTIKSKSSAVQSGLGTTLFERAMELYGDSSCADKDGRVSRMLRVQYRMHSDIANWASTVMYQGQLETHESVESRVLSQLPHVKHSRADDAEENIEETVLLLIDTAGCDMHETVNAAGARYNDGEAQIVAQHVQTLLATGLKQEEIAVISPYNGQVELLRSILLPDTPRLEIRSVDGFQGGEREAVVLSLVRSSDRGGIAGIGFLKDDRRLNVAVTRAKRHCALVCDTETVSQSKFVKDLVGWMEAHGVQRSAVEYLASSQAANLGGELQAAEAELFQMLDAAAGSCETNERNQRKQVTDSAISGLAVPSASTRKASSAEEERRKDLLDKITVFAESAKDGEEMRLTSDLSRFDRRVIHEFATQLKLGHRSEGVEGVDRRIVLTVASKKPPEVPQSQSIKTSIEQEATGTTVRVSSPSTNFAALDFDSDDSESVGVNASAELRHESSEPMNSVLGDLARGRAERQRLSKTQSKTAVEHKSKGKKKKKGKKLGISATKSANRESEGGESLDALDDMEFLDAQIERVQTSHGRNVAGKGQYRSIVNGILVSKPQKRQPERNQKTSTALQAKLKQSQNDRKSKKATKSKG